MLLTALDAGLIIIMLLSGFLALMRGFTREILSIASWGAAALAALFAYKSGLRPMVEAEFSQRLVADAILVVGTFFLTLIVVGLITARISDAILDSRIGALDRSVGFLFGLFRGLVIVVIGYLFFNWLVPEQNQPGWIKDARSRPVLESTGNWLKAQLPEDPEALLHKRVPGEKEEPPQEPEIQTPSDSDTPSDEGKPPEEQKPSPPPKSSKGGKQ